MNALALVGNSDDLPFIYHALNANRQNDEIFDAALTALANIEGKEQLLQQLAQIDVPISGRTVMSLAQASTEYEKELSEIRLDIENDSAATLKAGALLVGLDRSPKHLLSKDHPVEQLIGELNTHPDPYVSQYSLWATAEHPRLDMTHMRLRPSDLSRIPVNAKVWGYRVLLKTSESAARHHEFIVEASECDDPEVREGLAIGLRNIFYDGIEEVVVDWFWDEQELASTKHKLLEHMAVHSDKLDTYRRTVVEAYATSSPNSALRARLEAAAIDKALNLELRAIELQTGAPDLFSILGATYVTNNNMQFTGAVNAGGISASGTGNTGTVTIASAEAQAQARDILKEVQTEIETLPPEHADSEAVATVKKAAASPNKESVEGVLKFLKGASEGSKYAATTATALGTLYQKLEPLVHHLPHLLS